MGRPVIDLTGKKFGRLTVIKRVKDKITPSGCHRIMWLCECDCEEHNLVVVDGGSLRRKTTQSCGCLQKERISESHKKYNTFNLSGDYGIGYTSKGEEFWFDLEDYDKIKDYCWYTDNHGYIKAKDGNKHILFHRLIMGFPDLKFDIDHKIAENKHDNRKSNLRIATRSQNSRNAKVRSNSSSGVNGVYFDNEQNKWRATIGYNNKRINLGRFENFDDAVAARKEAEEKYFGEWSYDNSQNRLLR